MAIGKINLEISPTSKCSCCVCEENIIRGHYRLIETFGSGKWKKTLRYCQKCAVGHLMTAIADFDTMIETLREVQ